MKKKHPKLTLSEARQILGKDADNMSDEEIALLVDQLNSLARSFVHAVQNGCMSAVFMEYNKGNN